MEYTIRCDVESVDTNSLSQEFKSENCVYPRACVPKEQYKGNRLAYETDCNQVGWALAELNPCLRGKRGLIQRAVDSWRNSNQDPRFTEQESPSTGKDEYSHKNGCRRFDTTIWQCWSRPNRASWYCWYACSDYQAPWLDLDIRSAPPSPRTIRYLTHQSRQYARYVHSSFS